MSDDTERDDTERDDAVLGTALARAVESQRPRETPFERSRIAARLSAPGRGFPLAALAAAAAFVAVLALGAFVLVPRNVPAQPSAAPVVLPSPTPSATETPFPERQLRLFFARNGLPPLGAPVTAHLPPEAAGVLARVDALIAVSDKSVPPGAFNAVRSKDPRQVIGISSTVSGDLATVRLDSPSGWDVRGAAMENAFVQQLVYTITEEPGIRRVLLTDKGGAPLQIDQTVIDKPLTREDVLGYSFKGTDVTSIENPGSSTAQEIAAWSVSNTSNGVPGILSRVAIDILDNGPPCETSAPCHGRLDPSFRAQLVTPVKECAEPTCVGGKWRIALTLPVTGFLSQQPAVTLDSIGGPIRGVDGQVVSPSCPTGSSECRPSVLITIYLDDARPWRVSVVAVALKKARINVDIGGRPQQVNKNIAVYTPQAGDTTRRNITVTGAARVFEANVVWRVKDGKGNEVATGHTLASIGTSPVWGTFAAEVAIPSNVSGNVTIEVFHVSPKDGSELDKVEIPLTVR